MKKSKQAKASANEKNSEKPAVPAPVPSEPPASVPVVSHRSLDPEREELVYDERGDAYVRTTPLGMLEEAQAEADQRELADYLDSITLLRDKGMSFREIAEFLTKRGVFADHNAVYRIYTKCMPEDEIRDESVLDDQIEQDNALGQ